LKTMRLAMSPSFLRSPTQSTSLWFPVPSARWTWSTWADTLAFRRLRVAYSFRITSHAPSFVLRAYGQYLVRCPLDSQVELIYGILRRVFVVATEDRIRELCARAVSAPDEECELIVAELRVAINNHIRFLQEMTREMRERETASAAPTRVPA